MQLACSLHSCTAQFPRVRSLCVSLTGWHPEVYDLHAASEMCGRLPSLPSLKGEPFKDIPKKHQALLMPLISFFLTHALLFPNPPLYCSLSFSPLTSISLLFGAYWLRGRTCSGWKAIHPSHWESHDGQSGHSY